MVNKTQLFFVFSAFLTNFERFVRSVALCICCILKSMQNDIF